MKKTLSILLFSSIVAMAMTCGNALETSRAEQINETSDGVSAPSDAEVQISQPKPAADNVQSYLNLLRGKRIAIVANQTSLIGEKHLVDSLLSLEIEIVRVFGPEHGFRGQSGAGDLVSDDLDIQTGLPIISLYGGNKKPTSNQLEGIDLIVFDIQDVGARFYTYLSTMHYMMEACAQNDVEMIVLDRPNPNGHYVDGPMLKDGFTSFVGMHPIPVVHGMTLGELANMINKERWLEGGVQASLRVVPCSDYSHSSQYNLPIAPSPNLPSMNSIYLYPSLCFFEGTAVSVGRGTDHPFEMYGYPRSSIGDTTFTPESRSGAAPHPKYEGKECRGFSRVGEESASSEFRSLNLDELISMYSAYSDQASFFTTPKFFDKLAGSSDLRKSIVSGKGEEEIRANWVNDLTEFKMLRAKYLLYPDF